LVAAAVEPLVAAAAEPLVAAAAEPQVAATDANVSLAWLLGWAEDTGAAASSSPGGRIKTGCCSARFFSSSDNSGQLFVATYIATSSKEICSVILNKIAQIIIF
jgi:hypothetical protein